MKNFFFGFVVAAVIILGTVFLTMFTQTAPKPGAVSGPDISSPYLDVNGVYKFYNRKPLSTATTTVCAIQSPSATSTMASDSGITESVSSTTASVITIAKSASPYATTTIIGTQIVVGANAQISALASTTAAQDATALKVFAPNQWVVFGQSGGTGTFSPNGFCHADFTLF